MIGSEILARKALSAVVFATLAATSAPAAAFPASSLPECMRNAQELIVNYKLEAQVKGVLSARYKSVTLNKLSGNEVFDVVRAALEERAALRPPVYTTNYDKDFVRRIVGKALYAQCLVSGR